MKIKIEQLILKIKSSLSPELLKKEYRRKNAANPMYGHCYVATESLYYLLYLLENKYLAYNPFYAKDENDITHWWLQNAVGNILDPTAEQYTSIGKKPPYKNGKQKMFLTKQPSKRASIVIERVLRTL